MRNRIALIVSAAAVVGMCAFVFAMSAMPADDSTELSTGVIWHIVGFVVPGYDQLPAADQLRWQEMLQYPVRKTAHFLEYALLGALATNLAVQVERTRGTERDARGTEHGAFATDCGGARGAKRGGEGDAKPATWPKLAAAAWIFTTAYAGTDELHQLFVPGRTGQFTDVMLDSAGTLAGIAVFLLVAHVVTNARRTRKAT